jgi:hypothetical protein
MLFQIYSFVYVALVTANPSYRVYFRQQRLSTKSSTDLEEDDYSLIIGIRLEHFMDAKQQLKVKCKHILIYLS